MLRWHISKKDPNVPSQAEAGGNAFVEDGEELPNPATNLVREAIQNSLDKRLNTNEPVLVRFTLGTMNEASVEPWLGTLMPHAASSWPQGLAKAQGRPRSLAVEDFNTLGLNGDFAANTLRDAQGSNDFFYFWRAQNISPKGGQGGGSWGVGKTTYYLLSHIGTIMGLSVPSNPEFPRTVMGRCHLTEHSITGNEAVFQHFGYGCDPEMPHGLCLPLISDDAVDAFREAWPVVRDADPGLSIVIPFLRADLEAADLVRAVIEEYPYPIVSGDLTVIVTDERGISTTIDHSTVSDLASTSELSVKAVKHLTLSQTLRASQYPLELSRQELCARPSTELGAEVVDTARESLSSHGFVHFRVPLQVTKAAKDGASTSTTDYVDVILQESDDPHHFYIRSGLWVKGEPGAGVPRPKSMDTLLVLHRPSDSSLPSMAELLGRFEGASHRAWDATLDEDRRPNRYIEAQAVRTFVRRLPSELSRAITLRAESEHFPLAEDWFSSTSQGTGSGGQSNPTGGRSTKKKKVKSNGRAVISAELDRRDPRRVRFTVQGKTRIAELRIRVGYEQQDHARSSNLDKWSKNDFGLQIGGRRKAGNLKVSSITGRTSYAKDIDGNTIICLDVNPADFGLVVEGLDEDRGLQWDAAAWDAQGQQIRLTGGES